VDFLRKWHKGEKKKGDEGVNLGGAWGDRD